MGQPLLYIGLLGHKPWQKAIMARADGPRERSTCLDKNGVLVFI